MNYDGSNYRPYWHFMTDDSSCNVKITCTSDYMKLCGQNADIANVQYNDSMQNNLDITYTITDKVNYLPGTYTVTIRGAIDGYSSTYQDHSFTVTLTDPNSSGSLSSSCN